MEIAKVMNKSKLSRFKAVFRAFMQNFILNQNSLLKLNKNKLPAVKKAAEFTSLIRI